MFNHLFIYLLFMYIYLYVRVYVCVCVLRTARTQPCPMNACDATKSKDSSLYESCFHLFVHAVVLRKLWMGY